MNRLRLCVVLAALAAGAGCGGGSGAAGDAAAPDAAVPADPLEITAEEPLLGQLRVDTPQWATVAGSQRVSARIEVDQARVTRVGSPVMGRVSRLSAHEGQLVRRGDVLATLNSTGLSDAQLAFLRALSNRQLAERAEERARLLLDADVIGSAELQRRQAELAQTRAELAVAHDQLVLLGMPEEAIVDLEQTHRINSVSRIVASMDGIVLQRLISLGQVVEPADTAFEIADLSSLWLQADVPEQEAGDLRVGTKVEAEVAALPGVRIEGALSFVSATVDEQTRTVLVRMDLPNRQGRFKPAMLATVTLKDKPERRRVVPAAAVVREADAEHVFVQRDDGTFVLRPVSLGDEIDGQRILLDGLRDGDRIVVDGAFHLNNERRRRLVRGGEDS